MAKESRSIHDLYSVLFTGQSDSKFVQFFRYLFVGGFSAVTDIGTLFVCASMLHIHYLIAAALAFLVGNVVNYVLSMAWVFSSSGQVKKELFYFTIIGLCGLLLNELIIWIAVEFGNLNYMVGKLLSVSIIVVFSFSARRVLMMKLAENKLLREKQTQA
jgi:putative flippase GtrA